MMTAVMQPEIVADRGTVSNQEAKQKPSRRQLRPLVVPLQRPTAVVAPVMHWVEEMGIPIKEAVSTDKAVPSSIEKPRVGEW